MSKCLKEFSDKFEIPQLLEKEFNHLFKNEGQAEKTINASKITGFFHEKFVKHIMIKNEKNNEKRLNSYIE